MSESKLPGLDNLGWGAKRILLSPEKRVKRALGIRGRSKVGPSYVCKDGPVSTTALLDQLPKEY